MQPVAPVVQRVFGQNAHDHPAIIGLLYCCTSNPSFRVAPPSPLILILITHSSLIRLSLFCFPDFCFLLSADAVPHISTYFHLAEVPGLPWNNLFLLLISATRSEPIRGNPNQSEVIRGFSNHRTRSEVSMSLSSTLRSSTWLSRPRPGRETYGDLCRAMSSYVELWRPKSIFSFQLRQPLGLAVPNHQLRDFTSLREILSRRFSDFRKIFILHSAF